MAELDQEKLKPYLAEKLDAEELAITGVWFNLEGWSMETFSIGLSYKKDGEKVERDIIIRKEPAAGLMDENYDVSIEYRVITALGKTGKVAVPETYWMEHDPEILGKPFYVMEKVEGDIPFPPGMSFDPKFRLWPDDEEREAIADDFVKNLAGINNADWKGLGLDFLGEPGTGTGPALKQIKFWEDRIAGAGFRDKPAVAYAAAWLKDNLVECDNPCLIHGDYRAGNFITRDRKIVAILDWELVSLGDPMFDISYTLSAWRSAPPNKWISHLLPREEFFERYEDASGIKIDEDRLDFYMLLHHFKALGISATAAGAFRQNPRLNLKIGAFSMMQYAAGGALIKELNRRLARRKGA
jgi:aminoglycoside phosphotransferase (APT) family kinase protein